MEKKITLGTVKAFIKNNINNLYVSEDSRFDGMNDCVMPINGNFKKVDSSKLDLNNKTTFGIKGIFFGSSKNWIEQIENGFYIYNSCCSFRIVNMIETEEIEEQENTEEIITHIDLLEVGSVYSLFDFLDNEWKDNFEYLGGLSFICKHIKHSIEIKKYVFVNLEDTTNKVILELNNLLTLISQKNIKAKK